MSVVSCGRPRPNAGSEVVFMTKVSKLFIDPDWELMIKYLQSCLGLAKDELKAPGLSDHQWRSDAASRDMGSGASCVIVKIFHLVLMYDLIRVE